MKVEIPTQLVLFAVFMNSIQLSFQSSFPELYPLDLPHIPSISHVSHHSPHHSPHRSPHRSPSNSPPTSPHHFPPKRHGHDTAIWPNGASVRIYNHEEHFPPPLRTQSIQHPFDTNNFIPPAEDVILTLPNGVVYKSITGEKDLRIIYNRNNGIVTILYKNGYTERINSSGHILS